MGSQLQLSRTSRHFRNPKGIEAGAALAKSKGAKRVLPLPVHGAFHSGLMKTAEDV